jgi:HAD superfamily hydrolase (TIGR01509 family)
MFAVIFDFDGTILDSETAEFLSHRRLFEDCGTTLTEDEWCEGIGILQPKTHWFDRLCERAPNPPDFERFQQLTREYFREHVPDEPMPGVSALLGALITAGVPRAVASGAPSGWVRHGLDSLGLTTSFDAVVTSDQVSRGKPAPDVYLEAARRMGIDAARCVALEDSGPGLASARAAGMRTIVIPHPLTRLHDLSGADLQVKSAADLTLDTLQSLALKSEIPISKSQC